MAEAECQRHFLKTMLEMLSRARSVLLDYYGSSSHGLELREEFTCIHIQETSVVQGGQHIAGRAPFVFTVAVSVPMGAHLLQVAEGTCRASVEKITTLLQTIITEGNDHFHRVFFDEDLLPRQWGGSLVSLLACHSLPVAAAAASRLLHRLGVVVLNMGGAINDLQED